MLCDVVDAASTTSIEGSSGAGSGAVDVVACNRLLHALGRHAEKGGQQHQHHAARALLELMASGRLGLGAKPDVVSYTTVLDALGKAGDWAGVSALLQEMGERGDPLPNLRTYTVAMRTAARAGRWERCLALLGDVARWGIRVRRRRVGFGFGWWAMCVCTKRRRTLWLFIYPTRTHQLDAVAYNTALEACARAKQATQARALLVRMEKEADIEGGPEPDLMSYTAAIRAHEGPIGEGGGGAEKEGNGEVVVTAVRGLLRRLQARGLEPDVRVYNAVLRVCAQRAQWRAAGDVLREMAWEAGFAPDEWTVRALTASVPTPGGRERGQTLAFLRRLQDGAKGGKERDAGRSRSMAVARVRGSSGGGGRR